MRLAGLQKLTLLDFPGEVACTVFTQGCNLRCPFCQNPELVLPELFSGSGVLAGGLLPEDVFFDFLSRRQGKLSGVVVSGGEPTLHRDLPEFLLRIRRMGYLVKLDTNGLNPEMLSEILQASLVDYVAMDVKNSPGKYEFTCGREEASAKEDAAKDVSAEEAAAVEDVAEEAAVEKASAKEDAAGLWERARKSIALLRNGQIPYEFRTTVVSGLHTGEDIREMAKHLAGARAWYLQQFVDSGMLVGSFQRPHLALSSPSREEMEMMKALALDLVPNTFVRGVL